MKKPEIEKRIRELLDKMTLEEKAGQLHQSGGSMVGAFDLTLEQILTMVEDGRITEKEAHEMLSEAKHDWHEDDLRAGRIGSYLGITHAEEMNRCARDSEARQRSLTRILQSRLDRREEK